jgi:hypothetical protein
MVFTNKKKNLALKPAPAATRTLYMQIEENKIKINIKEFKRTINANSTPKCDTRLCSLKVFFEHHFGLPESEAFTRPQV